MRVVIFGPNLMDQSKGQFHVHAAGCGDAKHYGPRGKYGGEEGGWEIEVAGKIDIVWAVYSNQLEETGEDEAGQNEIAKDWLSDFWFAPCCEGLTP